MMIVAVIAALLHAALVAGIAVSRSRSAAQWFVLGLVAPIVSLIVVLAVADASDPPIPDRDEALRRSPVLRELRWAARPVSAHELARRLPLHGDDVAHHLSALLDLGAATRHDDGTWSA